MSNLPPQDSRLQIGPLILEHFKGQVTLSTLKFQPFAAEMENNQIYDRVREHYGAAAQIGGTKYGQKVAKSFGYSEEELESIPSNANLGLSCGNPLVIAKLKEVGLT